MVWGSESADGRDIVITKVDVDNLLRTKAAIYAGFSVLATSVGLQLSDVQEFIIAGAFGQYINIEKAIQIGLLPDMPWEQLQVPGQHERAGRVHGAALAARARANRRSRQQAHLSGAVGGQFVLRSIHVGAVFAAHGHYQIPVGAASIGRSMSRRECAISAQSVL